MKIELYTKNDSKRWDRFVQNSDNGTIFHTQKFLSYHPKKRFKNTSLIFEKNNKILAVLPATEKTEGRKKIFSSHAGATLGGIIHRTDLDINEAEEIITALTKFLKRKKYYKAELTPTSDVYHLQPSKYIEFAMTQHGYNFKKRELTSVINLNTKDISLNFKPEARTAYRKALKLGVKIKASEEFSDFYSILSSTLRTKYNVNPTHTLKELENLRKMFPKEIHLTSAFYKNRMIAGVMTFICNSKTALAFYITQDSNFQNLRPLNYLFHTIFNEYKNKGYSYYDLGLFTVNMKTNFGLARFKESLGGNSYFREYYELYL